MKEKKDLMQIKSFLFNSLVFLLLNLQAQDPVQWKYSLVKNTEGYAIHLTATLEESWHIYAQVQPKEAISAPTQIQFNPNPLLKLSGKPKEFGIKETYTDPQAGIIQYQYGHTVDFVQQFQVKAGIKTSVSGTVTYQVCTNERCLQPKTVAFSLPVQ